jgi:predicted nucleic acid-binding protein
LKKKNESKIINQKVEATLPSTAPKYFLDSSTLIHAIDKNSQFHEACLNIVIKCSKGEIDAATSLETLEETLYILSKLTTSSIALGVITDLLKMSHIKKYEMDLSIFEQALEIIETTPLKKPKDAINVATMLENKIRRLIISEDKDYDRVQLIQRIHPKELVESL